MQSYFAMSWDRDCQRAARHAEQIRTQIRLLAKPYPLFVSSGLLVADLSEFPQNRFTPITGKAGNTLGCIFGNVFELSEYLGARRQPTQINIPGSRPLTAEVNRYILGRFWGNFIAFTSDGKDASILAEPIGSLPCYHTEEEGVLMAFSNMELCEFIDRRRYTINTSFVRSLLIYDKFVNGATGLNEVAELSGGQELHFEKGQTTVKTSWNPRDIALEPRILPQEAAATELAATTDHVVASWASRYDDISLSLSGGLDSSIVLDCLKRSGDADRLTAFHYSLESSDAGELHYAQAAAAAAQVDLDPIKLSGAIDISSLQNYPLTVRPTRQLLAPDAQAFIAPPDGHRRGAVFTGQGGDHLFLADRSVLSFADHLQLNGLTRSTPQTLIQTARLSGKSVWSILYETLWPRKGPDASRSSAFEAGVRNRQTLMNSHIVDNADTVASLPEWARDPGGLPPGKFRQVSSLMHMMHLRPQIRPAGPRDLVHPLISRPLLEACLRYPTYLLSADGVSRGLARKAFQGRVPELILRRTSKGAASRFYSDQVAAIATLAEQELSSGELYKMGLIQPDDVRKLLGHGRHRQVQSGNMVLIYLGIEYWLRAWHRKIHRTQADR